MATSVLHEHSHHDSVMSTKSDGTESTQPDDLDDDNDSGSRHHRQHKQQSLQHQQQQPLQSRQPHNGDNPSNPASDDDEFHLSLPALLLQHGQNLAQLDQTVLAECLQPVMRSLRNLDAETLLGLERVQNGARLCDGVNVRPIHDEVFPRYDLGSNMSCVRYIHITEVPEQYSIGIFVFPPFSRIPLHDHPEMCVLSRLLYGDLQCLSLDVLNPEDEVKAAQQHHQQLLLLQQQQQQQQQHLHSIVHHPYHDSQHHPYQPHQQQAPHHYPYQQPQLHAPPPPPPTPQVRLPDGSRRVLKNPVKHLHAPDVSMLFPFKGNLHEFFAGPHGAAVLDILLPPYDMDHDRDCTFYDIREDPTLAAALGNGSSSGSTAQPQMMMDVDPSVAHSAVLPPGGGGGASSNDDGRIPCWIVPTCQPYDFHCLSGKYQKLGTNVIAMQDS